MLDVIWNIWKEFHYDDDNNNNNNKHNETRIFKTQMDRTADYVNRQDTRPLYISALNIGPRNINRTYNDMIKYVLSYTSTYARKQE